MKKKVAKANPLKFFNDQKALAVKKAGGAMKSFTKSLKKAQDGLYQGPLTEDVNTRLENNYNSDLQRIIKSGNTYGFLTQNIDRPALNKIMYEESWRTQPNLGAGNSYSVSQKKKIGGNVKTKKK